MSKINIKIAVGDKITSASLNSMDAESFALLASALSNKPDRTRITKEHSERRGKARYDAEAAAEGLLERVQILSSLSRQEMAAVFALVKVLKMRDPFTSESNWLLELVTGILYEVTFEGPEAVLIQGPGGILRDLSSSYNRFLNDIEQSQIIVSMCSQEAK
jgi:hypothetical protein